MTRPFRLSRGRRLASAALAASSLLAAAATPAFAEDPYRSNNLSKDVVIVSGPEVPASCRATEKLENTIERSRPTVDGRTVRWSGTFKHVYVNPKSSACSYDDRVRIDGTSLENAAAALSKQLETWSSNKAVDVVALGTGGPVLRYAMLMSARKRAGLRSFGEVLFGSRLDIEDVVTVGAVLDGAAIAPSSCGGGQLCADLVRPPAHEQKPIQWQLMDSAEQDGRNPQGVRGTDWSVIGLAGDRFAPPETSTGMDAAHKTVYEDEKVPFLKALADDSEKDDAKLRFMHAPETEWTGTNTGPHLLYRIAEDLVFGVSKEVAKGDGPAYAEGCTGLNDGGATVIQNPVFTGWRGDKRAVRTVKAGTIDAIANCFKNDPKKKDVFYVDGSADGATEVRINGLDFVLKNENSRLNIDTKMRTVTRGSGSIQVELPVTAGRSLDLWNFTADDLTGDLNWKFPSSGDAPIQTEDGKVFALESPELTIKGWKVKGAISMTVSKGIIQLDLSVALPGIFSSKLAGSRAPECDNGIDDDEDGKLDLEDKDCGKNKLGDYEDRSQASGVAITLGTSNVTGLQIDKFGGSVGGALKFGPFRSEGSIAVSYDRRADEIKVDLEAALPALSDMSVKLGVGFKNGELSSISGEINGLNIPLWNTGWFMQKFGVGVSGLNEGQQLEILVSVGMSLFKKFGGKYLAFVDGDVTVSWGAPWKFKLGGAFSLLDDPWGNASLEYEQNVGGKLTVNLGRPIEINDDVQFIPSGSIVGQLALTGELDIGANIQACFKGDLGFKEYEEPTCFGKVDMRLTRYLGQPLSQAVCFKTPVGLQVGFHTTYDIDENGFHSKIEWIGHACDVADYGAKKAQVAAPAIDEFTILPGTDRQVVSIHGAGGQAPNVVLVAPDGRRIAAPTDGLTREDGTDAFAITGMGDATAFVLAKPQVGRWKVEAQGDSAVSKIDLLEVLPEPKVSAKVVREHHGFVLRHDVKAQTGQTVRFLERRGNLLQKVAESSGGPGETRFTPAFGPAGKREIVAQVLQDGRVRRELVVGSYVAPAPARPGKVKRVTVKRKGTNVTVTWSKAQRATGGYEVIVRLPDGRSEANIVSGARKVVLHDLTIDGGVEVSVRALRQQDEASGPRKVVRRGV